MDLNVRSRITVRNFDHYQCTLHDNPTSPQRPIGRANQSDHHRIHNKVVRLSFQRKIHICYEALRTRHTMAFPFIPRPWMGRSAKSLPYPVGRASAWIQTSCARARSLFGVFSYYFTQKNLERNPESGPCAGAASHSTRHNHYLAHALRMRLKSIIYPISCTISIIPLFVFSRNFRNIIFMEGNPLKVPHLQ